MLFNIFIVSNSDLVKVNSSLFTCHVFSRNTCRITKFQLGQYLQTLRSVSTCENIINFSKSSLFFSGLLMFLSAGNAIKKDLSLRNIKENINFILASIFQFDISREQKSKVQILNNERDICLLVQ